MIQIHDNIKNKILYPPPIIKLSNNKKTKLIYADFIATGRISPIIEKYLYKNVYPYYASTHSNALCSAYMNKLLENTKCYIKKKFNLKQDHKIIFTGQGATGAINHLVNIINYEDFNKVHIILSTYEHHSNYLPWFEKSKKYKNIQLYVIPLKNGIIDYNYYQQIINKLTTNLDNNLIITSVTACSNVSGIKTDLYRLKNIFKDKSLLFIDYACLSPYTKIDGSIANALFISPHKYIGGHSTPGILIADKQLFMHSCPYAPGGGCVNQANEEIIEYNNDPEIKETAGTPTIIGIVKIKLILALQDMLYDTIIKNEEFIVKYVHNKLKLIQNKYPNLIILYLGLYLNIRLPIICIYIKELYHNKVVKILSDYYGIQTRGGIACCGIFANYIWKTMQISGWCRISFHWSMTLQEIDYILSSIEDILFNLKYYLTIYNE